jgi:hypothetical protein
MKDKYKTYIWLKQPQLTTYLSCKGISPNMHEHTKIAASDIIPFLCIHKLLLGDCPPPLENAFTLRQGFLFYHTVVNNAIEQINMNRKGYF